MKKPHMAILMKLHFDKESEPHLNRVFCNFGPPHLKKNECSRILICSPLDYCNDQVTQNSTEFDKGDDCRDSGETRVPVTD